MTQPTLKLSPLPDTKPVKLSIQIDPALSANLEDYARVYKRAYGNDAEVSVLIPHMLEAFLASDAGFKRARKSL